MYGGKFARGVLQQDASRFHFETLKFAAKRFKRHYRHAGSGVALHHQRSSAHVNFSYIRLAVVCRDSHLHISIHIPSASKLLEGGQLRAHSKQTPATAAFWKRLGASGFLWLSPGHRHSHWHSLFCILETDEPCPGTCEKCCFPDGAVWRHAHSGSRIPKEHTGSSASTAV